MQTGRIKAAKRYQNNKVSIVIPCYNQGEYLEDAVRSVLSQTYKDIEIIIVDDGSTDKTATVANMLISGNNKILFIQHEKNRGLSAARNTGIGRASGRFILPLDADDKISPDCIEKSVTFKNSGTADIVYGICQCFGTANNLWNYKYNLRDLLVDSLFQCSALFEKAHWRECGGYNEQLIKGREDWDFWLRMAEQGHFGYRIEEVLFYYRKKQQSMLTSLLPQYNDITELVKGMHANLFINQSYIPSSNSNKLTINQQIRAIMSERSIPLSQKRIQIGKVRRSVSMEERMRRRY
jgi:glycosyltransferase involved in cell wall biosynthesis